MAIGEELRCNNLERGWCVRNCILSQLGAPTLGSLSEGWVRTGPETQGRTLTQLMKNSSNLITISHCEGSSFLNIRTAYLIFFWEMPWLRSVSQSLHSCLKFKSWLSRLTSMTYVYWAVRVLVCSARTHRPKWNYAPLSYFCNFALPICSHWKILFVYHWANSCSHILPSL